MTSTAAPSEQTTESERRYRQAPVIEGVIEVQFLGGLSDADISAIGALLAPAYAKTHEIPSYQIQFADGGAALSDQRRVLKYEGVDPTEVATVHQLGFGISQLFPYKDWEALFGRFAAQWSAVAPALLGKKISRIATRFINQIEVPLVNGAAEYEMAIKLLRSPNIFLPPR